MKYISRLTALLLAFAFFFPSLVSAQSFDDPDKTGLTRSMLDALYEEAEGKEEQVEPGVLGDTVTLEAFNTVLYKDFVWYDGNGNVMPQVSNTVNVTYTMEEQRFVCHSTGNILGILEHDKVFVVPPAQVTDMLPYLDFLYRHNAQWSSHAAVYSFVMSNWNVTLENGDNLAAAVIRAWVADMSGLPDNLFCTCVALGGLNHRDPLLSPDGGHLQSCPWFNNIIMPPLPEQPPLFDGEPDGEQYTATETVALSNAANRAVILPEGGRAVLTYSGLQAQSRGSSSYNWQIFTGEDWVDIQGDSDPSIVITEAKINSITQLTGVAQIRYLDKDNSVVLASASLTTKAIAGGEYVNDQPAPVSLVSQSRADDTTTADMFDVVVNYVYDNIEGESAGSSYSAQVAKGEDLPGNAAANPPTIVGYDAVELVVVSDNADVENQIKTTTATKQNSDGKVVTTITSVDLSGIKNVQSDISIYIIYKPGEVKFTIRHYFQNVNDDDYDETPHRDVTAYGITGTPVGGEKEIVDGAIVWEKSWYLVGQRGFKALPYDPSLEIAPNGSTVVEIYYDRSYYLLGIDLNGGTGAEPVYARFGAPVSVDEPTRIGYTFAGWILGVATYAENGKLLSVSYDTTQGKAELPTTMPAVNSYYQAQWVMNETAQVTVVFWGENPNDEEYSVMHSATITANSGTTISYADGKWQMCGVEEEHTHTSTCSLICDHDQHTYSCYSGAQSSTGNTPNNTGVQTVEGYVGEYSNWRNTYNVIRVGNSWYRYEGNVPVGSIATPDCGHHTAECYSCGKLEHTHSASCTSASFDTNLWTLADVGSVTVNPDGTSILNVKYDRTEFTLTFKHNSSTVYTIQDKWGANISGHWPIVGNNGTTYNNGECWQVDSDQSGTFTTGRLITYLSVMPKGDMTLDRYKANSNEYNMHYRIEVLPGETGTLYNGKTFEEKFNVIANYGSVTKDEDFFDMEGFTQFASEPSFGNGTEIYYSSTQNGHVYFYYGRNSYKLEFMSSGTKLEGHTATVKYEAPLASYNFDPPYPTTLTSGAYEFAYWCMDESLQQPVNWDKMTMPAANVMVYAKWVPKTFTVLYFRNDTDMNTYNKGITAYGDAYKADPTAEYLDLDGDQVAETLNQYMLLANPDSKETIKNPIPYGEVIPQAQREVLPATIQAEPVGWFYIGEDGKEHAFDYSTPITHDMQLYVKWTSSVLVEYVIYYRTKLDNGSVVDIAEPTMGFMLGMTTKTFPAKGGEDLYAADSEGNSTGLNFQNGYYPETNAHSLTAEVRTMMGQVFENEWFEINDEAGLRDVQGYVFMYVKSEGEPYKVRYLTTIPQTNSYGTVDITDKDDNVTTYYRLAPDKVIEKKDNTRSIVTEVYEPVVGYKPDAYQKRLVLALEGGYVAGNPDSITENVLNFFYVEDSEHAPLHIIHYVQTIGDGYEIYTQSTDLNALIKDANGQYMTYSEDPLAIDGYTHVVKDDTAPFGKTVTSGTMTEKGLQLRFYYDENLVTYNYKIVGPDGDVQESGTYGQLLQYTTEIARVMTGTVYGTTAEPISTTYKFVGWYKDAECTQPVVDAGWVTDNTIKPQKTVNQYYLGGNYYEGYPSGEFTYYAKFEYNLTDLMISKAVLNDTTPDRQESFLFTVEGEGKTFQVVLTGNDSVIISGLTVGQTYTITENQAWSNQYTLDSITPTGGVITLEANRNIVTFTNKQKADQWLNDESSVENVFNTNADSGTTTE